MIQKLTTPRCEQLSFGEWFVCEPEESTEYEYFSEAISKQLRPDWQSRPRIVSVLVGNSPIPFEVVGTHGGMNGSRWKATRLSIRSQRFEVVGTVSVVEFDVEVLP